MLICVVLSCSYVWFSLNIKNVNSFPTVVRGARSEQIFFRGAGVKKLGNPCTRRSGSLKPENNSAPEQRHCVAPSAWWKVQCRCCSSNSLFQFSAISPRLPEKQSAFTRRSRDQKLVSGTRQVHCTIKSCGTPATENHDFKREIPSRRSEHFSSVAGVHLIIAGARAVEPVLKVRAPALGI